MQYLTLQSQPLDLLRHLADKANSLGLLSLHLAPRDIVRLLTKGYRSDSVPLIDPFGHARKWCLKSPFRVALKFAISKVMLRSWNTFGRPETLADPTFCPDLHQSPWRSRPYASCWPVRRHTFTVRSSSRSTCSSLCGCLRRVAVL